MPTLIEQAETLTQRAATLRTEVEALGQKTELTADELKHVQTAVAEAKDLDAKAAGLRETVETIRLNKEALAGYGKPSPRKTGADAAAPIVAREAFLDDPMRGFPSERHMLAEVRRVAMGAKPSPNLRSLSRKYGLNADGSQIDPMAAAGSDEQSTFSDPYGGFLMVTTRIPGVKSLGFDPDPIYALTQKVPMASRRVEILARVDKNHSASVSGGLQVYRRAEAAAVTASRMSLEQVELQAYELFGVAYATEEVLRESPESFVAIIERGFRDEFGAKRMMERLDADGVGRFLGIGVALSASNLGPTLDVAKESGQAAASIVWANLAKMRARCYGYGNAVWYANHDTLPQLMAVTQPGSTVPLFTQDAQGIERLFGRPIYFGEFAKTLGTVGDIVLGNWAEYLEGEYEPIQGASSIHVRFVEHEQCFKFWTSNAGAPWWRTALTPKNGATLSPFVRLATRA